MAASFQRNCFARTKTAAHSRNRIFSKENTFWAFFLQVLDADGGCSEVVRKLKAYAALKPSAKMSVSTGSYCKARAKITEGELQEIYDHTVRKMQQIDIEHPLGNRRVIVVDGTGVSMPDTEANQIVWPQQATQKPGCGFPGRIRRPIHVSQPLFSNLWNANPSQNWQNGGFLERSIIRRKKKFQSLNPTKNPVFYGF